MSETTYKVIKPTGDAELIDYKLDGEKLTIRIKLWDEKEWLIVAEGVKDFNNSKTHNIDAFVSLPSLDSESYKGYGLISPENNNDITMSLKRHLLSTKLVLTSLPTGRQATLPGARDYQFLNSSTAL